MRSILLRRPLHRLSRNSPMHLLAFIKQINRADLRFMALLTVIAGLANALLMLAVNNVAGDIAQEQGLGLMGCLMFAGAFLVYYLCDRYSLLRANGVVERQLKRMRLETVARLRQSEIATVEAA